MILVHHLNHSRSQRILWLLEELGLPYDVEYYERTPVQAPPELAKVHPLGKAPVLVDNGRTLAESGAIIDYLLRHYGKGRLQPDIATPAYDDFVEWLHYAEGSAMAQMGVYLRVKFLGEAGAATLPGIKAGVDKHLAYTEQALTGRDYLDGEFTAADIQMSFFGQVCEAWDLLGPYDNIKAWLARMEDRSAYKKALERGGFYSLSAIMAPPKAKA